MLTYMKAWFTARFGQILPRDEKGQDAAEYALLIGLIALIIVAAVTLLGTNISAVFSRIASTVATW